MKNRLALLFAVLGFATIICLLVFSRDNKLAYQTQSSSPTAPEVSKGPANASGLSPTIQTLAEIPAPQVEVTSASDGQKPEPIKQPTPKTKVAKAKG